MSQAIARAVTPGEGFLTIDMVPVGLLVSCNRTVQSCNLSFCKIFGYQADWLAGRSLEVLYPSPSEFAHVGERALEAMLERAHYSDERIMKRQDGQLFWCRVTGQPINQEQPFAAAVWVFEDISEKRPITTELTAREREIAHLLVAGSSNKEVGKALGIGYRTVEAHRARLMRKVRAGSSNELIARLGGWGAAAAQH